MNVTLTSKILCLAGLALAQVACDDEVVVTSTGSTPEAAPADASVNRKTDQGPAKGKDDKGIPAPVDFQETSFVESERSRDPFRNYAQVFVEEARGQVKSQREVVLEQYAVEELKLVAIIGRIQPPRAMLVDPAGVGHVVVRGQFIGRASVVQPTGGVGAAYEVNWRVDRIRDGDLVLVRDDPSNPDVPSATRVLPLQTDEGVARSSVDGEPEEAGVETELRRIQERLAAMVAAEAAKSRTEEKENP